MSPRSGMRRHVLLLPLLFTCVLWGSFHLNEVNAVMCYVCNVKDHWQCATLKSYPRRREEFLFYCNGSCATMYASGEVGPTITDLYTTRGCYPLKECERNGTVCCICDTNECNMGIKCLMMGYKAGSTGISSFHRSISDIIKMGILIIIWSILITIKNHLQWK